ncbi:MAG TPA: hypothetical protein VJP77_05830 [Planctomycetota bacterium]|nr:hypothetical protein [Planctomycetota bacterium]
MGEIDRAYREFVGDNYGNIYQPVSFAAGWNAALSRAEALCRETVAALDKQGLAGDALSAEDCADAIAALKEPA